MNDQTVRAFVADRFADRHGATPNTDYRQWRSIRNAIDKPTAALGYRGAGAEPLFLERYLTAPIEDVVSKAVGRVVPRRAIAEIGCLAALPSAALLTLWQDTAADLAGHYDVAVATLTLPLRRMFSRVGISFVSLCEADVGSVGDGGAQDWGRYYDLAPMVCAGEIAAGAAMLARHPSRKAA